MKKIYVLHEYGAENHYNGLKYLCKQHNVKIVFREFRVLHLVGSGIKHRKFNRVLKQFVNIIFLMELLLTRNKKVLLGMHPYDNRLPILSYILKRHKVYYHSSYTTWFPYEKDNTKNTSGEKLDRIKRFINKQVIHIFAVTKKASDSLCAFTGVDKKKVSIVYHSYLNHLSMEAIPPLTNYIYIGRMDTSKGIEEICEYFAHHSDLHLTLIGDGNKIDYVKKMSTIYKNINFVGFVKGLTKLQSFYNKNAFFILNSKKTKEWEELFGQVIIEAMSCGCVPIAVNHSGPKEIISHGVNGYLFEEGGLASAIDSACSLSLEKYNEIRNNSFKRGHDFESNKIASYWKPILE